MAARQVRTIGITVFPGTGRPQTNPVAPSLDEDSGPVPITLTGLDTDGSVVTFKIVDIANLHGRLYDADNNLLGADSEIGPPSSAGVFTVYFVPDPDFNGQATFTFGAVDDSGLENLSPATATITVNPVDDAPIVSPPSPVATDEDASVAITGLSVTEVDGDILLVQLNATSTITLASLQGLTGVVGNGTSSVTFTGTAAAINAALNGVMYAPTPDHSGSGSISYSFNDGVSPPVTGTIDVTIAPVNDAPVLVNAIADQVSNEGAPWVFQVPAGTFSDVDSSLTYTATLKTATLFQRGLSSTHRAKPSPARRRKISTARSS